MNILVIILTILIIVFFYLIYKNNLIYVKTTSGNKMLVYKDDMKTDKANLLNTIITRMYVLRDHLINNIHNFKEYESYIRLMEKNFNKLRTNIYETDPSSNLTSYSVNKGEELSFCLKSKHTNKLHDINLLMYVAIHEMAHTACPEIGHTELYKRIFKKFLEEAITLNIYNYINYEMMPTEYCGMTLNSSII
jgi:predicted metal-dependent hydrolase